MLFRRRHFPLNRKIYEDNCWVILLIKLVLSRFYVESLTSLFHMHRPATLFPFLCENTWRHGFLLSGVEFKVLNTGASFLSKISHMANLASFRSNVPKQVTQVVTGWQGNRKQSNRSIFPLNVGRKLLQFWVLAETMAHLHYTWYLFGIHDAQIKLWQEGFGIKTNKLSDVEVEEFSVWS